MQAGSQLLGIVLAGGESRRMQRDKGALSIHGQSQAEHCLSLLEPFCQSAYISVRESQSQSAPYLDLPLLIDDDSTKGPAAGLLAGWATFPECALFVLAVDLLLVRAATLEHLVSNRNEAAGATAFRHTDGTIEPLCTIWEPKLQSSLGAALPSPSLRRILQASDVELLQAPNPGELVSANTPEAVEAVCRGL